MSCNVAEIHRCIRDLHLHKVAVTNGVRPCARVLGRFDSSPNEMDRHLR